MNFIDTLSSLFPSIYYQSQRILIPSYYLKRTVTVELIYPKGHMKRLKFFSTLFLNDGQDLEILQYQKILEEMYRTKGLSNLLTVAIHAGERIQEYGVAGVPDFKGRGARAGDYQQFLALELWPLAQAFLKTPLVPERTAFVGFSLGGLAAFDFAWNYSGLVSKVGVFSGSFWWRTKDVGEGYQDSDRIMHNKVKLASFQPNLKFWLQTGTLDEVNDRNHNGIIDSIEDTLDLATTLHFKGYSWDDDINYIQVEGGEHNQQTWSQIMPQFLEWAFL